MEIQVINAIPIIGWLLSFILATLLAIPFWFIWTFLDIGEMFTFLPMTLRSPSFLATIGIFMCLSIFRAVAFPIHKESKSDD